MPEFKVQVLYDGIWHFVETFPTKALAETQKRDLVEKEYWPPSKVRIKELRETA